jgi:hypothetical protein
MRRTKKIYAVILTIFFLTWILLPILNNSFQVFPEPSVSKTENRTLAREPVFNINLADPYPFAYENYFTDHFIFRQQALSAHSFLIFYPFKRSPVPNQVDIGKGNWLFNGRDDKLIYQGKKKLTSEEVRTIVRILHERALYYRGKRIHFYLCFAPMTQEIYPEYLPNNYFRSPNGTQTDKLISAIIKDTVIPFIDLKSVLLASKKFGRLYQNTDNHWNNLGGYFAYTAIIKRIKKDFPKVKLIPMSDITFKHFIRHGGGLANIIGFADALKEYDITPVIRNAQAKIGVKAGYPPPYWFEYKDDYEVEWVTPDQNMPKLFVIRDSFFAFSMMYMQESFSKTTVIWDSWMYGPNKSLIEKEKPDIVLLMILEPLIDHLLTSPTY